VHRSAGSLADGVDDLADGDDLADQPYESGLVPVQAPEDGCGDVCDVFGADQRYGGVEAAKGESQLGRSGTGHSSDLGLEVLVEEGCL
jgi:hypothetical protein